MAPKRPRPVWILTALLLLAVPVEARAQAGAGWTPAMAGIRIGNLEPGGRSVLGAQLHLPVLPGGWAELTPNADITFLHGLKEYQYSVDALFISGGRHGGLMVGGGPAFRNSVFEEGGSRETRKGWDLVVGLKTMPGQRIPFGIELQERWIFMKLPVNPRVLSFGVNLPLWGWGHFGS